MLFSAPPEPVTPSNAEAVKQWWDECRIVSLWTKRAEELLQHDRPSPSDLKHAKEKHDKIERLIQEISVYDTKVTLLLKKGSDIVDDSVTDPKDGQRMKEEMKSLKDRWDNLQVNGFSEERRQVFHNEVILGVIFSVLTKDLPGGNRSRRMNI